MKIQGTLLMVVSSVIPKTRVPSGILREDAMALVESFIPNYTKNK